MDDKAKKSLEIINREISRLPSDVAASFLKRFERHSYSARLDAHHGLRNVFSNSAVSCAKTDLLILSGRDTTNEGGKANLLLDSLLCGAAREGLDLELVIMRTPNFVATPRGTAPAFATVIANSTTEQVPAGYFLVTRDDADAGEVYLANVTIEVTTWKPDGTPAANTAFSWICTIEAARLGSIGG